MQAALLEKENGIFLNWSKTLLPGSTLINILNQPVIKFYKQPDDALIEVNLDASCLENLRAIIEYVVLNF